MQLKKINIFNKLYDMADLFINVFSTESGATINPATETTLESMLNALFDFTDPDNPVLKLPGLKSDYSDDSTQLGDSIQITNKPMPVTFYTNAASPTAGTMFGCNGERKNLLLTITRTNVTSNTIQFYRSTDGNYFGPLLGTRINPDASITTGVSSTSTATEMWEFDIEGVEFVSMYLSAIAGTGAGVTVAGIVI